MLFQALVFTSVSGWGTTQSWSNSWSSSSQTRNGQTQSSGKSSTGSGVLDHATGQSTFDGTSGDWEANFNHNTGKGSAQGQHEDWSGFFDHNTQKGWQDGQATKWNTPTWGTTNTWDGPSHWGPMNTWTKNYGGPIGMNGEAGDELCEDVLAHAEKMKAMLEKQGASGCQQLKAVLADLVDSINALEYFEETAEPEEGPMEIAEGEGLEGEGLEGEGLEGEGRQKLGRSSTVYDFEGNGWLSKDRWSTIGRRLENEPDQLLAPGFGLSTN